MIRGLFSRIRDKFCCCFLRKEEKDDVEQPNNYDNKAFSIDDEINADSVVDRSKKIIDMFFSRMTEIKRNGGLIWMRCSDGRNENSDVDIPLKDGSIGLMNMQDVVFIEIRCENATDCDVIMQYYNDKKQEIENPNNGDAETTINVSDDANKKPCQMLLISSDHICGKSCKPVAL